MLVVYHYTMFQLFLVNVKMLQFPRYWQKRNVNNQAAKRSREARRLKENQIAMRARFLEEENNALKLEVEEIALDLD